MKELLEDMLLVLNAIPNRKLRGKEWTTYDLAKRVEEKLKEQDNQMKRVGSNLHQLNQQIKDTYKL